VYRRKHLQDVRVVYSRSSSVLLVKKWQLSETKVPCHLRCLSCSWRINITWLGFQYPTLHLSLRNYSETRSISACLSPGRIFVYQHDHLLTLFGFKYDNSLSYMSSRMFTLHIWRFTVSQLLPANSMEQSFLGSRYQPTPWSGIILEKLISTNSMEQSRRWEADSRCPWGISHFSGTQSSRCQKCVLCVPVLHWSVYYFL
jgi:hypothetical protein